MCGVTTYILNGFTLIEDNSGRLTRIEATELRVQAVGNYRLSYVLVPDSDAENFTEIDFLPVSGIELSVSIGGLSGDRLNGIYLGTIRWGAGKSTELVSFNFTNEDGGDGRSEFLMVLGGDPLPRFDTATDALAWERAITDITGRVASISPNTPFRLEDLDAFASRIEADRINLGRMMNDDLEDQTLNTGAGNDFVNGNAAANVINLGTGDDTAMGRGGADRISGGAGDDRILGGVGNDRLVGQGGTDTLDGGTGQDRIVGGAGADRIIGGQGNDTMAGGAGADTFVFGNRDGNDRVTGFAAGSDRIDLSRVSEITDADDLAQNHIRTRNGNVIIDMHDGSSITLVGVTENDLHRAGYEDNFIF